VRPTDGPPTLGDVIAGLERNRSLSGDRRRDLRSGAKRVARLIGEKPDNIPLDLPAISQTLASVMPAGAGLSQKTLSNIRSNFLAAVRVSGIGSVPSLRSAGLLPSWSKILTGRSSKRVRIGLSRFGGWCSGKGVEPEQVDDSVLADFIEEVRGGTLHPRPNRLHRDVAQIWNEVADKGDLPLRRLAVPSFRGPPKRLNWSRLPASFQSEHDAYLHWCSGDDAFAADARSRALKPQTVTLQSSYIHAAVTALVDSGIAPKTITALADLVTPHNFKCILRRRHEMADGRANAFNRGVAWTLIDLARRWVKIDNAALEELKRLATKLPALPSGLTDKNKAALRQFDDPKNLLRLIKLPDRLWEEVKRDKKPNGRTLLKAQAAIAIGLPLYAPVRMQNLWNLEFGKHIFLHNGPGAISSLEIDAGDVKNQTEIAFDIPPHMAKKLAEYRDHILPKVIGRRNDRLFVKADGTAKNQWAVAWLIRTTLRKRLGLQLSPHQFRHLAAKVILDAEPGNFETVRQLLAHKSLRTTVSSYTGISSRRAARHHQHLLEQALAAQEP